MTQQTTQHDLESALTSLESAAANFGARFVPDSKVRLEYNVKAKQLSAEIRDLVKTNKISAAEGARRASEMRNVLMDAMRGESSEIGRAYAINKKTVGVSLAQLEEKYALARFGEKFSSLLVIQRNCVWRRIVFSAGRPQIHATQLARLFGAAGRSFIAATIAISAYNVLTADNRAKAVAREGAVLGGGLLGSVAGGAAAGLACGPGAPVCVSIGVFVGGVMFALGAQVAFEAF